MSDMCHNNIKMHIPIHFRYICTMVRSGTETYVVIIFILYSSYMIFFILHRNTGEHNTTHINS